MRDAHCLEKPMQDTSSAICGIWVMCGEYTQNHVDLNCVFLPVTYRSRAKSLTEFLDNTKSFC